ncbi:MAG: sigma-70 family RNA polymerase sigma factor [Clostridia bacterium]|nr:sigma-70 family RNA polymerase sigma factor [Clostridia bacterium]
MTNHEIDSLMRRIACGDMEALEALYKGMSKPVYFYVLRILGSPEAAEDVMQDTFISVMSNCGSYRESEKGSSWIFTVARNKAIDFCRKRKNVIPLDEAETLPDTENSVEKAESESAFLQLLSPLNDKERDIVMLRLLSDMTLTQVARELDMPKGSVFWAYNNAVKKLRKLHKGESGDEK